MKSLTLIFYAAVTFMLGVITLSSIPLALASAYGNTQAQIVQSIVLAVTIVVPIAFLAAIPFVGNRRGE